MGKKVQWFGFLYLLFLLVLPLIWARGWDKAARQPEPVIVLSGTMPASPHDPRGCQGGSACMGAPWTHHRTHRSEHRAGCWHHTCNKWSRMEEVQAWPHTRHRSGHCSGSPRCTWSTEPSSSGPAELATSLLHTRAAGTKQHQGENASQQGKSTSYWGERGKQAALTT